MQASLLHALHDEQTCDHSFGQRGEVVDGFDRCRLGLGLDLALSEGLDKTDLTRLPGRDKDAWNDMAVNGWQCHAGQAIVIRRHRTQVIRFHFPMTATTVEQEHKR